MEKTEDLTAALLEDAAKLWLAHDGLWFQAVEKRYGIEKAIEMDKEAWETFTVLEAKRIMSRHGIAQGGGMEALKQALRHRLYAHINEQEIIDETDSSFVFRMTDCRVQSARERKGMDPFPCKEVGVVEYSLFARTIDARIKTSCLSCPPDKKQPGFWCAWKFELVEE